MFREKYFGNLLQMIFECGDFFRYRNMELIADSHFGHMVPVAFLRLWDIFATFAARPSRLGVSHIPELVSKELSKEEMAKLLDGKLKEEVKEDTSDESDYSEVMNLEEQDEKLKFGMCNSEIYTYTKKRGENPNYCKTHLTDGSGTNWCQNVLLVLPIRTSSFLLVMRWYYIYI